MAYQNSVYRSGSEPHRGGASEIPEPPPAHRPVPSYAARGRHMSDSAISVHRSKHHPSQQKYKAELRVLSEDGTGPQVQYQQLFGWKNMNTRQVKGILHSLRQSQQSFEHFEKNSLFHANFGFINFVCDVLQRKISDPGPYRGLSSGRTSSSSLGSTSASGSSSQHSTGASHLPTTVEVAESTHHGYSMDVPVNEDNSGSASQDPSLSKRTSSRSITLSSNLQTVDSQASKRSADTKSTDSSLRSRDPAASRVHPYESQYSYPCVSHGQTGDVKGTVMEEQVVPEYAAEAQSSTPIFSSPSHQSQRYRTDSPTHYKMNSQQSQSQSNSPFIMGTVYSKPTSPSATTSSSISKPHESHVTNSMRVPPAGTSSAAFITATSGSEGYHQPHRISGAYPGPGYSKDRRRGSSPTNIPSQSQSYRRGIDTRDDDHLSSQFPQAPLADMAVEALPQRLYIHGLTLNNIGKTITMTIGMRRILGYNQLTVAMVRHSLFVFVTVKVLLLNCQMSQERTNIRIDHHTLVLQ